MKEAINRIKVVLADKNKTNKWLAEQLGKDPATVSKWCTNTSQPGVETLIEIARILEVEVGDLLRVPFVRTEKESQTPVWNLATKI